MLRRAILLLTGMLLLHAATTLAQQRLLDIDTTQGVGKMFNAVFRRYDQLRFSGYIQTQFQMAESKGAESFAGGDFAPKSASRFMLRRGRMRMDYAGYNKERDPEVFFVFQFDGTERGVAIRDFWGRIFDTRWHLFSVTTGMFARPMGFELSLSSSDRESPERGRMSQILMPTERDLGVMVSFEDRDPLPFVGAVRLDAGVFNGQGLAGTTDFDSHKDVILRLAFQPLIRTGAFKLSSSFAVLYGGVIQGHPTVYAMGRDGAGRTAFIADSSASNLDAIAPRRYINADAQISLAHAWGNTELRAEYMTGLQPGSAASSRSTGTLPLTPTFRRAFAGGYFYLLQHLLSPAHQLILKYDWYDPNTEAGGEAIGVSGTYLGVADIKYSTFGIGYCWYTGPNMKVVLYYDMVTNESTQLAGYGGDVKDNILTCRIQYRF